MTDIEAMNIARECFNRANELVGSPKRFETGRPEDQRALADVVRGMTGDEMDGIDGCAAAMFCALARAKVEALR